MKTQRPHFVRKGWSKDASLRKVGSSRNRLSYSDSDERSGEAHRTWLALKAYITTFSQLLGFNILFKSFDARSGHPARAFPPTPLSPAHCTSSASLNATLRMHRPHVIMRGEMHILISS